MTFSMVLKLAFGITLFCLPVKPFTTFTTVLRSTQLLKRGKLSSPYFRDASVLNTHVLSMSPGICLMKSYLMSGLKKNHKVHKAFLSVKEKKNTNLLPKVKRKRMNAVIGE